MIRVITQILFTKTAADTRKFLFIKGWHYDFTVTFTTLDYDNYIVQ